MLLGNSPNRVMPGRLVERVSTSDKLVAGLHPDTPGLIQRLYARIVTRGTLHPTKQHDRRGGEDAGERVPRRAHRLRRGGRAALRPARPRLLRPAGPGEQPARPGRPGQRRPQRGAERRPAGADGRRRRPLPPQGRHPALVAGAGGEARHLTQPDPRRPAHQRRLPSPDPRARGARLRAAQRAGGGAAWRGVPVHSRIPGTPRRWCSPACCSTAARGSPSTTPATPPTRTCAAPAWRISSPATSRRRWPRRRRSSCAPRTASTSTSGRRCSVPRGMRWASWTAATSGTPRT